MSASSLIQRPAGVEECSATLDGHRMRYVRAGSGPPLLLLHGLLASSFSWRYNLAALAGHATLVAPDLLGTGYSDRPAVDYGLDAAAERLLRFAEGLGLGDFDLLGTSHGGAVAMRMAEFAAERGRPRIRSLILVAPANPWSPADSPFLPLVRSRLGKAFMTHMGHRVVAIHDMVLRRLYGDRGRIRPGTLEGYSAPLKLPGTIEYVNAILDRWAADMTLLESGLDRIRRLPTLMVWGTRDRVVKPHSAATLRTRFDLAEVVLLSGVGHLPYEEVPEEFNRVVTAFLANRR